MAGLRLFHPLRFFLVYFVVVELLEMFTLSLQACLRLLLQFQVSRTVSLLLHMNGTYRAHWADRLGFCKHCLGCLNFCLFPVLYGVRNICNFSFWLLMHGPQIYFLR